MNLTIMIKEIDNTTIITCSGRIDTLTAPEFEKQVYPHIDSSTNKIILELTQVDYISSSGLRVFIISQKKCHSSNKKLVLTNMTPEVKEVFDISGLSQLFEFSEH